MHSFTNSSSKLDDASKVCMIDVSDTKMDVAFNKAENICFAPELSNHSSDCDEQPLEWSEGITDSEELEIELNENTSGIDDFLKK